MKHDPQFLKCPVSGCGQIIERAGAAGAAGARGARKVPRVSPCGRMLSLPLARHMADNRFRCSGCEGRSPTPSPLLDLKAASQPASQPSRKDDEPAS